MRLMRFSAAAAAAAVLFASAVPAVERSEIPAEYKWDLTHLYADEAAWAAAKQELVASIPKLGEWQGKLGSSPATLLAAMADWEKVKNA